MDADRFSESTQFARKLHQAVQSLRPGDAVTARRIPRMAQALALAELMADRAHDIQLAGSMRAGQAPASF